jgi:hypothetical protein
MNKLGERVAPWLKIRLSGDPSLAQIITAVDKIVYDDGIIREKVSRDSIHCSISVTVSRHAWNIFNTYPRHTLVQIVMDSESFEKISRNLPGHFRHAH